MANKLASAVTSYTPSVPVSTETADSIRALATERLGKLALEIDDLISAASSEDLVGGEEEVIIITSPPP